MDDLLDRLSDDLAPVPRRALGLEGLAIVGVCALELGLFLGAGMARPDLGKALGLPVFWWKLVSLGALAALGVSTALRSFDPQSSPHLGLRIAAGVALAALVAAWPFDVALAPAGDLLSRLHWRDGLRCLAFLVGLATPPALLLTYLMRKGAPTQRAASSWAIGIGVAAWAAFVFVFACPHDDPLYVAVWYGTGCGLIALIARLILPPLARW